MLIIIKIWKCESKKNLYFSAFKFHRPFKFHVCLRRARNAFYDFGIWNMTTLVSSERRRLRQVTKWFQLTSWIIVVNFTDKWIHSQTISSTPFKFLCFQHSHTICGSWAINMKVIWFICNVLITVKACVDPEGAGFLKPPWKITSLSACQRNAILNGD